jgi:site-specific DNA recombinase
LRRELTRIQTSGERLLTAYQEGLLTLEQLRKRMPELRKQQQAIQSELTAMELAAADQSRYLQLTHALAEFRERLRVKAETMDMAERQRILRLRVKEILVGAETITIRHCIGCGSFAFDARAPFFNRIAGRRSAQAARMRGDIDTARRYPVSAR